MTTLVVTNNVALAKPATIPHYYAKAGTGDLVALKAISDAWPVPSWVNGLGGTIGSQRTAGTLDDDSLAYCLLDFAYRNLNFTGGVQVTTPPLNDVNRSLESYQWRFGGVGPTGVNYAGNAALNAGKGPTMSCGSITLFLLGFFAAYGLVARSVTGGNNVGGADTSMEYWSVAKPGWVHVLPHANEFFALPNGTLASFLEWGSIERTYLGRVAGGQTLVTPVYKGGSNGSNFLSGSNLLDWVNYSRAMSWGRGHAVSSQGATRPLNSTSGLKFVLNQAGAPVLSGLTVAHLDDLYPTVNAVGGTARINGIGNARVELEAVMINFSGWQMKKPGGAWQAIDTALNGRIWPTLAYEFFPLVGDEWQFKAVGTLGESSNPFTIDVAA